MAEGTAKGLLVDIARDVLAHARVSYQFDALPQKRLVDSIQKGDTQLCALGLFKNPERMAYATFTKPIYQNKPIGVLVAAARAEAFAPYKTLAELSAAPALSLTYVEGFSYGPYVDGLTAKMGENKQARVIPPANLVSMLNIGRIDYMFADPEEYEALAASVTIDPARLRLLSFPDIPAGNQRYLMCSKAVPKDVMDRIDAAIPPLP